MHHRPTMTTCVYSLKANKCRDVPWSQGSCRSSTCACTTLLHKLEYRDCFRAGNEGEELLSWNRGKLSRASPFHVHTASAIYQGPLAWCNQYWLKGKSLTDHREVAGLPDQHAWSYQKLEYWTVFGNSVRTTDLYRH
jgi:hypothetical protein